MSQQINISDWDQLLKIFQFLKIPEIKQTTFLEIIGKSNHENIWSRILAFYFDNKKEHGYEAIILQSLIDIYYEKKINEKKINLKSASYKIFTEFTTNKGGRIDIVIISDDFTIGIENKVDAELYNNLEDYSKTLDDLNKSNTIKIVLSKRNINIENKDFVNILYEDFISKIRGYINSLEIKPRLNNQIFLLDFIYNIEKQLNSYKMIENKEVVKFFENNLTTINQINEYKLDIVEGLYKYQEILYYFLKKELYKLTNFEFNFREDGIHKEEGYFIFFICIFLKGEQILDFQCFVEESDLILHISINGCKNNKNYLDTIYNASENSQTINENVLKEILNCLEKISF